MASSVADHLTPRARQIAAAAREIVDADGVDALSMRGLAARIGIRAPSIYKHFESREAVEATVISIVFEELAILWEGVVEASDEPLLALADAQRDYARRHPHLYLLVTERPLDRPALVEGIEERAARPMIAAAGEDRDLARAIWAFVHGMATLELNAHFRPDADLDAAWQLGIEALAAAAHGAPSAMSATDS
jgi:AcrR family transcriptional regulator